jgi:hypothetical protein
LGATAAARHDKKNPIRRGCSDKISKFFDVRIDGRPVGLEALGDAEVKKVSAILRSRPSMRGRRISDPSLSRTSRAMKKVVKEASIEAK